MDVSIVASALGLVMSLVLPVILAAAVGALLAGLFRVVTQIEDPIFGYLGRLLGVAVVLYVFQSYFSDKLMEFATRLWGGPDIYG
jgi:type III secretory pathway component EscS